MVLLDLKKVENTAKNAAKTAGDYLLKEFLKIYLRPSFKFKNKHEILTKFDLISEKIIFNIIHKNFPQHDILSEEKGFSDFKDNEFLWIYDPLDGTTNFSIKNPLFAISIAFVVLGKIFLGVIYVPIFKEIFLAKKDGGAYLNNQRIFVSSKNELKKSFLTYCHGSKKIKDIKRAIKVYNYFKLNAIDIRQLGSAAIELSWVAAGRIEAIMIPGTSVWDVAAGALLVQEAGGKVTDWQGKNWNLKSTDILASNSKIHNKILKILKKIKT